MVLKKKDNYLQDTTQNTTNPIKSWGKHMYLESVSSLMCL